MKYVRFTGKFSSQTIYVDGVRFGCSGGSYEFPMFLYDAVVGIGMFRRGLADGSITETRFDYGVPEYDEIHPFEELPDLSPPAETALGLPPDVDYPSTTVDEPTTKKPHHKKAT